MDLSTVLIGEAVSQVITLVATVAITRTKVAGMSGRLSKIERKIDEMPKDYVPRTEVELALRGIESNTKHTNAMVQAIIYGEDRHRRIRDIEAAAAPRDFAQIVIEGVDGKGGLNRWEGTIPFFYLDNRKKDGVPAPLVTVGKGCALDLGEALTLPFEIGDRSATQEEIAADFAAVHSATPGLVAHAYAGLTRCRLSEEAMDDLVRRRFAVFICALRHLFPTFDSFPVLVKAGCLDLIYGLGPAGLSPPHYPAFRLAVGNFNWPEAAKECASDADDKAYAARNAARAALFLQKGTA